MTEHIVSKEIAIAAHKAGFNKRCDNWYRIHDEFPDLYGRNAKKGGVKPPIKSNITTRVAPSNETLLNWIFKEYDKKESLEDKAKWLEYWCKYLLLFPLKFEFIWRMRDKTKEDGIKVNIEVI